jgi:hypothetical protein
MNRGDDEFEDFLTRRKPVFSRGADDPLEPPDELDRLVLHQAREAVKGARPQRVFTGPRWGAPLAVAATLVLALTVILNGGKPATPEPTPEVTVQTVAQRLEPPAAAAPAPNNRAHAEAAPATKTAAADATGPVRADRASGAAVPARGGEFVSEAEASRYARNPPVPSEGGVLDDRFADFPVVTDVSPPPGEAERALAKAAPNPAFRADSKRWLAEIERLRAAGKDARADAEYAEYKRQHRAYAVSPDR